MYIAWFGERACQDVNLVGGKAANLSRLAESHRVPPGFCMTARAHERWLAHDPGPADLESLPPDVSEQLKRSFAALHEHCDAASLSVAVRSSAVDEDGESASFAGQHETYLNVTGEDALVRSLIRCWESARTERALAYRSLHGLSRSETRVAVLVQQMVRADVSAVVFSADPVDGRRDRVVINASWGLGESIVGGTVTPDVYLIDKRTRDLVERRIGSKGQMHVAADGGTTQVAVPRMLRSVPALSEMQIKELAELACGLEQRMGHPVDVECSFSDETLYLLQCRPITRMGAER